MPLYEPPPGFDDLLGDCEDVEDRGVFHDLEVPGVGVVRARKPMPNAAGALSMSVNAKIKTHAQAGYLTLFVRNHLAEDEFERLTVEMMDPDRDLPSDTIARVARCISTWGTARPTVPSSA